MVEKVRNLIPNIFLTTRGSGESDLKKYTGSYHMVLYGAGISDFNIMMHSSVISATAHLTTMGELDLPPFGSEMKTVMAVSYGHQDELVSAGVVYAWIYKDRNFNEKVGDLVYEVSGHYHIEELESRLVHVISDLHQKTCGKYYPGRLNSITGGITIEKRYGTALAALCFVDFLQLGAEEWVVLSIFCDAYRAGSFQEPVFLLALSSKKHTSIVFVT